MSLEMCQSDQPSSSDSEVDSLQGSVLPPLSIQEYEDQYSQLKKENFNLKLRIYFMEERMGVKDENDVHKKIIELNVEREELRNDLKDKQTLLVQSLEALEVQDQEFKKEVSKLGSQLDDAFNKIAHLENEMVKLSDENAKLVGDRDRLLEEQLSTENEKRKIETELSKREQELGEERRQSAQLGNNLQAELTQNNRKIKLLEEKLESLGKKLLDSTTKIQNLEDSLCRRDYDLQIKDVELKKRDQIISIHLAEIEKLRKICDNTSNFSDYSMTELKNELEKQKFQVKCLETNLEFSQQEIKRLQNELESSRLQRNSVCSEASHSSKQEASTKNRSKHTCNQKPQEGGDLPKKTLSLSSLLANFPLHLPTQNGGDEPQAQKFVFMSKQAASGSVVDNLNQEQKRVGIIINSFLACMKNMEKQADELRNKLKSKDEEMINLITEIECLKRTMEKKFQEDGNKLETKLPEINLSATMNAEKDSEYSDEIKQAKGAFIELEKFRQAVPLMKKQIENLQESVEQKEAEIATLKKQFEAKDNRITVLDGEIENLRTRIIETTKELNSYRKETRSTFVQAVTQSWVVFVDRSSRQVKDSQTELDDAILSLQSSNFDNPEAGQSRAMNICCSLASQLEVLGEFLNILLRHRLALGFLDEAQRRRLKEKLEDGSEFMNRLSLDENPKLKELNEILGRYGGHNLGTLDVLNGTNTSLSVSDELCLEEVIIEQANVISELQSQVEELRKQLEEKKSAMNKKKSAKVLFSEASGSQQDVLYKSPSFHRTDSEAWSEPDHNTLQSRIAAINEAFEGVSAENTLKNKLDELETSINEKDEKLKQTEKENSVLSRQIQELKKQKRCAEKRAKENDDKILRMEENKTRLENLFEELEKMVIELKDQKESLRMDLEKKSLEMKESKSQAEVLEGLLVDENKERENLETELRNMSSAYKKMEHELNILKDDVEHYRNIIEETETEMQAMRETIQTNENESIHRRNQMNRVFDELESLKESLKMAEDKIMEHCEIEILLRKQLDEMDKLYREREQHLVREANEATVTVSQTVIANSELVQEKAELEHELQVRKQREFELVNENSEMESQLQQLKEQAKKLREQKIKLKIRTAELESVNADLHSQMVEIRNDYEGASNYQEVFMCPTKLPKAQNKSEEAFDTALAFAKRIGDVCESGVVIRREAKVFMVRDQCCSPLSQSFHNLFNAKDVYGEDVPSPDPLCVDIKNLQAENSNLRCRLQRTKRALEETVNQLSILNETKRQVEKTVCKKMQTTSLVLRKARYNLNSGSDSAIRH